MKDLISGQQTLKTSRLGLGTRQKKGVKHWNTACQTFQLWGVSSK